MPAQIIQDVLAEAYRLFLEHPFEFYACMMTVLLLSLLLTWKTQKDFLESLPPVQQDADKKSD